MHLHPWESYASVSTVLAAASYSNQQIILDFHTNALLVTLQTVISLGSCGCHCVIYQVSHTYHSGHVNHLELY